MGIRREVNVTSGTHVSIQKQIPDHAPHEVQPIPGRGEPFGEWRGAFEYGQKSIRYHGRGGYRCQRGRSLLPSPCDDPTPSPMVLIGCGYGHGKVIRRSPF
jgi:hypothetical protein